MSKRSIIALVLILALALGLRLFGIMWGLPDDTHLFSYHPDEYFSLMAVWSFSFSGDLNPHYFNYGTLYFYLVLFVAILAGHTNFSLDTVVNQHIPPPMRDLVLDARLVTVALAVLTVLFVFLAARRLFGNRAGLIAAFILAVTPLHVIHGRYATVDVPMTFWVVVCLYFAARIVAQGRTASSSREDGASRGSTAEGANRRRCLLLYAGAGAAAGLAAATKYSGGLALALPLTAALIGALKPPRSDGPRLPRWWVCIAVCLVGLILGFLVGCPYAVLSPHEWWGSVGAFQGVSYELHHMKVGEHPAVDAWPNGFLFHLFGSLRYGLGPALMIVLLISLGYACYRRAAGDWLIIPFVLAWYLMIGAAHVRYMRYAIPLLPMLAILGGRMSADVGLTQRSPGGRWWCPNPIALLIGTLIFVAELAALAQSVAYGAAFEPRDDVLRKAGVRPGDSVGLIWSPWFCHPPVDYVNGGEVLNRNPVWRGFARSQYDVRVVGYAPDEADLPKFLITTRFEIRDARKAQTRQWCRLEQTLKDHYEPPLWALSWYHPPLDSAPSDWLYPFPDIEVYRLRSDEPGA